MTKAYIPLTQSEYSGLTQTEYEELMFEYVGDAGISNVAFSGSAIGATAKNVRHIISFSDRAYAITSKSARSSIKFPQSASAEGSNENSHTVTFNQKTDAYPGEKGTQTVELSHIAEANSSNHNTNSIEFKGKGVGYSGELGTNTIRFTQTAEAKSSNEVSQSITFNDNVQHNETGDASNSIEFNQHIEINPSIKQTIAFSHIAEYTIVKKSDNKIVFTQSVGRVGSIYNRKPSNSISFSSFATAYKSSDNPRYIQPSPNYPNPPDPTNPDCEIKVCDLKRVHFIKDRTNIELRCPETTETLVSNAVEHYTVAKEIKQVNRNNNFRQLDLNFTGMPQSMRDTFRQFYINTAGQEITYLDDCGNKWTGVIISNEIDFNQSSNGYMCPEGTGVFEFQFKFEGVLI